MRSETSEHFADTASNTLADAEELCHMPSRANRLGDDGTFLIFESTEEDLKKFIDRVEGYTSDPHPTVDR